ncbi:response regulator [Lacrimispora sp.]|uniref:response regulator transcription factor n=1 Tax=Lacrimispora sp. TaxID=2719234 RepID=UPI0029E0B997|nr:two-component system, response regulator YesN [Lacrimispora sp.]
MLKLIIADDERVIRESISSLIDWNSLGIELVGTCRDGIEAYHMILDESPDIVMTDIRMPGLSGLELIERIYQADMDTQFILLSGFGEFEYAKQAMKYRVHHYLLKPCNEEQIVESMQDVIKEYYHRQAFQDLKERQKALTANLHHSIMGNIINEQIFKSDPAEYSWNAYSGFMDFYHTGYELCFLHYLEETYLNSILSLIYDYMAEHAPGIELYCIYVKNSLILFFERYQVSYEEFDVFMQSLTPKELLFQLDYKRITFQSLNQLLEVLITKIRRYGIIYYMNGLEPVPTCNYKNLITKIEQLTASLIETDGTELKPRLEELTAALNDISNTDFLKQACSRILIKLATETSYLSSVDTTEYLMDLNQQTEYGQIRYMLCKKLNEILKKSSTRSQRYSPFIDKIIHYVEDHLGDPNLTLKCIAENHLFMNVDYVSKRFSKETKQKFSNYITALRIQKAKQLLAEGHTEQIQWVAQQVGCGNNPQYFSQIFKKSTGMTPSAYAKKLNGGE